MGKILTGVDELLGKQCKQVPGDNYVGKVYDMLYVCPWTQSGVKDLNL